VEIFYGIPFAFMGVVGSRLWSTRRRLGKDAALKGPPEREEAVE